jgi:hypothetical protein
MMEGQAKRRWTPAFAGVTFSLQPSPNNVIPAKAGIQDSQGNSPAIGGIALETQSRAG